MSSGDLFAIVIATIRIRSSACFRAKRPSVRRSSGDAAAADAARQRSLMAISFMIANASG
jgi:hypothetical protein